MARQRVKLGLISSYVRDRERATAREVAYGLQMSIPDASRWLHHLHGSGELQVVDRARVQYAKRPVAVYGPAQERLDLPLVFSDDWLRRD